MNKRALILCVFSLMISFAFSQNKLVFKSLKIGDKIPGEIYNSLLSGSKGKLIILDFWNIWCKSCIESMPKMQALQRDFGDKVKIILVTQNTEKDVIGLFTKIRMQIPALAMINEDSIFSKLFLHEAEPFHVWINENGQVLHLTEGYYTTASNIKDVLAGREIEVSVRNEWIDIDLSFPFISQVNSRLKDFVSVYTLVMRGIDTISTNSSINIIIDSVTRRSKCIQLLNISRLEILNLLYSKDLYGFFTPGGRIGNRFIVSDSINRSLRPPSKSLPDITEIKKWANQNIFSYEGCVPTDTVLDVISILKKDVNRYMGIHAVIELRPVECLVVIQNGDVSRLRVRDSLAKSVYSLKDGLKVVNSTLDKTFIYALTSNNMHLSTPIIDRTGYKSPVSIQIKSKLTDIDGVRKELQAYGLDIVKRIEVIPMLVVQAP